MHAYIIMMIVIVIGSRATVRLRQSLFGSLLRQDIGFFDTTKTGDTIYIYIYIYIYIHIHTHT